VFRDLLRSGLDHVPVPGHNGPNPSIPAQEEILPRRSDSLERLKPMSNDRRPLKPYPSVSRLSDPERVQLVKEIFATVTGKYDFLNHALSLRRDVAWRRFAVSRMRFFLTHRLLDAATGTCDLAMEAASRYSGLQVTGLDLVPQMIEAGRRKIRHRNLSSRIHLVRADALHLPFDDAHFDAVSMAFGIRNIPDRLGALREMIRVLVPGGRILILEMTIPSAPLLRPLYTFYLQTVLPRLARAVSPNPEAYHYLADSIENFPSPKAFARLMRRAGLERVQTHSLTCGITCLHVGIKPGGDLR
jgi:demethylmenaquinone methyltransferase/2-methoxy-6-polyprenyl-1,4-benzoquinol methylase